MCLCRVRCVQTPEAKNVVNPAGGGGGPGQLDAPGQHAVLYPGQLALTVHKVQNLYQVQSGTRCPYVKVTLPQQSLTCNTVVDQAGGATPPWAQRPFGFTLFAPGSQFRVEVFNQTPLGDEFIGGTTLSADRLAVSGQQGRWYPLVRGPQQNVQAGSVYLTATYTYNVTAPAGPGPVPVNPFVGQPVNPAAGMPLTPLQPVPTAQGQSITATQQPLNTNLQQPPVAGLKPPAYTPPDLIPVPAAADAKVPTPGALNQPLDTPLVTPAAPDDGKKKGDDDADAGDAGGDLSFDDLERRFAALKS